MRNYLIVGLSSHVHGVSSHFTSWIDEQLVLVIAGARTGLTGRERAWFLRWGEHRLGGRGLGVMAKGCSLCDEDTRPRRAACEDHCIHRGPTPPAFVNGSLYDSTVERGAR